MRPACITLPVTLAVVLTLAAGCTGDDDPASTPPPADEPPTLEPGTDEPQVTVPEDELAALEALGYVDRAPTDDPATAGVTTARTDDAVGLNLYGSRDRAEALLVDMEGQVVHRWESELREAWMHVEPLDDGHILAITKDVAIAQYDWDSELVWRTRVAAHHDLAVRADGHVLALTRGRTSLSHEGETLGILSDSVAILDPEGQIVERHPLLPLFRGHLRADRLNLIHRRLGEGRNPRELMAPGGVADLLHTNSIAILSEDIEGVAPAGAILLSFRTLSRIAIVSAAFDEVLWIWGRGELDGQHDATQLRNGNLLVFDNGLRRAESSRVVEVDPRTAEVVWTYDGPELFTRLRGGAQALSNGHVLVTESDSGHALEVTREGEVVWEFWNPDVRGDERATIYRLNRFSRGRFPTLDQHGG